MTDYSGCVPEVIQERSMSDLPPEAQYNRGLHHKTQFHATGNLHDINQAIEALLQATGFQGRQVPDWLNMLGEAFCHRAQRTGSSSDLDEGIAAFQKAVTLGGDGHVNFPLWLNNIAHVRLTLFLRSGNLDHMTEAINTFGRALEVAPEGSLTLMNIFTNLAIAYQYRFVRSGSLTDLTEATSAQRKALGLASEGHSAIPIMLSNLGTALQSQFKISGDLRDIDESISTLEEAADLSPEGDPNLMTTLSNLGCSYRCRLERTGSLSDLSEAISAFREAIDMAPEDHAMLPTWLSNLGVTLESRFQHEGKLDDINEAISTLQRGVTLTPEEHTLLPMVLNNLGYAYLSRFQSTESHSDIAEAVSALKKSIVLTPDDHPDLRDRLNNLGVAYQSRFRITGDIQDITHSLANLQAAVDRTSRSDPGLPRTLNNIGLSLNLRSQSSGNSSDIAEAIFTLQNAVNDTPEGHAQLPYLLGNLGLAFHVRYMRSRATSDLDEALSALRRSVELTPIDQTILIQRLTNLGTVLSDRFAETRHLSDVNEAISAHRRSLSLVPVDSPLFQAILNNLGWSLCVRSKHTGSVADMDDAIGYFQVAVALPSVGKERLPGDTHRLAMLYAIRFGYLHELPDMDKAVVAFKKALELLPDGHAEGAIMQLEFAKLLCHAGEVTGRQEDWDEGLKHYRFTARCTVAPARARLAASTLWARGMYRRHPHSPETILAFDTVVSLVALVAGLDQTLQTRYAQLQRVTKMGMSALEAAATAFELGRPDKAVEWLEQGRCLVWNQLTALRTPFDELRAHDSELARRMQDVSRRLEHAGSSRTQSTIDMPLSEKISLEDEAKTYLGLAKEWEDLLAMARDIEGFGSFLKPSACSDLLRKLPPSGFVVIINVHDTRCDAVALGASRNSPVHISLPHFDVKTAEAYAKDFGEQLKTRGLRMTSGDTFHEASEEGGIDDTRAIVRYAGRRGMKRVVYDVLHGLWTGFVKPILDALRIEKRDGLAEQDLPRIWWCPTGALTFLPIHAAGVYGGETGECLMDYAVSSYTPTVGALASRVGGGEAVRDSLSGVFLTSQPNAPGASAIPGTAREVDAIYFAAAKRGERVSRIDGDDLTVEDCLRHMEEYSGIHLACHASQNTLDPLKSRFRFHTGVLELSKISERNLKNADLAFLSACQTSTGEEKLSDEVVHLAAGMLAAGYRRVVATMWAISDHHAPGVATEFYEYLWRHGKEGSGSGLDGSLSAYALHHSIQKLRRAMSISEESLLMWGAYVHFGY